MASIQNFYSGRTVLVTGGTGFMGKVLLEKMIRSLPGMKKIYVLVRPKKGSTPEHRLKLMTLEMPFTHENMLPNTIEKLVCINGDVTLENLGLSEDDRKKIINEVSVVFNLAASIRMNLTLKEAVTVNVIGTLNILKFCMGFKHLASIVHLSTAYCNVDVDCMEEKVYETTVDPYKIIDLVQWIKDDDLKKIEESLISPHPNTYTFTKRLAEIIVKDMGNILPISVGRPSIVIPALKDPIPGWIDSLMGPAGFLVAGGKGVMKSMLGDKDLIPEVITVDLAINGLILIACLRADEKITETPVYNLTFGDAYKYTWNDVSEKYRMLAIKYPFKKKLWYTTGCLTSNVFVHYISVLFWHVFVAYAVDILLFLFLQEPFLVNVQDRLNQGMNVLKYFVTRKFVFINDNCKRLEKMFDPAEVKEFIVIEENANVDEYFYNSFRAARKYCLKEEIVESELYIRRIELMILYLLDKFFKLVMMYCAVFLILYVFDKTHLLPHSWYNN